jgi:thiol-disulfide isomerase/thioredoxin
MSTASHLKKDDFAPKFTLKDIDGKEVSLNDFKGKLIYIDFWSTWCAPCVAEMPASKKLQTRYESEDIIFLYISIDEDEKKWKEFVVKNKLKGTQLRTNGWNSPVAKVYGISAVPEYILIDQKGKIIKYGAPRPSENSITELFNQYLPKTKNTELPNFKFNPNEH